MVVLLGLEDRMVSRVVRTCLLAPCSFRDFITTVDAPSTLPKCLRLLSTISIDTQRSLRAMTPGLPFSPPSSLVYALGTIGHHQPVPSSNMTPPLSYYHRAPASRTSLSGIPITLTIALFFDFVYIPPFVPTSRNT